jgi:hypothetical protein
VDAFCQLPVHRKLVICYHIDVRRQLLSFFVGGMSLTGFTERHADLEILRHPPAGAEARDPTF